MLKKAGLDEATAIVTLTLSDEVNLEILKIAKQNNILRLSSIINDSSHIDKFKELKVLIPINSNIINMKIVKEKYKIKILVVCLINSDLFRDKKLVNDLFKFSS